MRPNRTPSTLAFTLAALAALVSGCVDELETGLEPPGEEGDGTAPWAADGDPPAWEGDDSLPPWDGEGPPPWAEEDPGKTPDSIFHPTRGRIDLTISTTDPLLPNAAVELTVTGVAQEPVDGGEVVLTLPTRALMDYAGGEGLPDLPVKARWDLPAMAKGDTWSGTYTVPGEAAGYYRVLVNAYTHGPDGGLWLFDDVLGEAWMYVSETDGRLTRFFEDSVFPEGVHPAAGPATGWPTGPLARIESGSPWHPDSVYLAVVYSVSERGGLKTAASTSVYAWRRTGTTTWLEWRTVPEDSWDTERFVTGVVAYRCAKSSSDTVHGGAEVPNTDLVAGRGGVASWRTDKSHCGQLVFVEVKAHRYLPWRLLNLAADTLTGHFGYTRGLISWDLRFDGGVSYYNPLPLFEKIVLAWEPADEKFFFNVAHEYGQRCTTRRSAACGGPATRRGTTGTGPASRTGLPRSPTSGAPCRRASPTTPGSSGRVGTGGTASSTSETPRSP